MIVDSTNWIFIGFSVGWMGTNNDFMFWGYIYQSSTSYESGDWASSTTISTTDFGSGVTLYVELGSGITGSIKEVYVTNHMEHFHVFAYFKSTFGAARYDWYELFNYDPHYIRQGCGNGHILSSESTEQCDDGNTVSSDGWSSTWQIENLYKWVNTAELSPTSVCTYTWGNAQYEPQYAEGWDDGNTSSNDGWSSSCSVETGWTCTKISGSKSICSAICGDGKVLGTEVCDDGNSTDNKGCKSDWSGSITGWYWSGGSSTTPDVWNEQCGDGYVTIDEQCDDGNTSNGDGWSSTWTLETGWTCLNSTPNSPSTCKIVWGDGLIKGSEVWDDGNSSDNKGWTSDCKGVIRGWYWSLGTFPASVWVTHLMDGIHVSPEESWDDGNSVNSGDGCTNSGTVESDWIWYDDILQKSIWVKIWGDSKRDNPNETWDDGNIQNGDGWSSQWLVENGWQWLGGSPTTQDAWYKQPNATINSVSQNNYIQIRFSELMTEFQPKNNSSYIITITGPYSPYQYTVNGSFTDAYTLSFNWKLTSQMYGQNSEVFKVTFDQSQFISAKGATLATSYLETSLNKVSISPSTVQAMGSSINSIMSTSVQ